MKAGTTARRSARISKRPGDPPRTLGYFEVGRVLIMLDRGDYWQCGFVVRKGELDEMKPRGVGFLRTEIARVMASYFHARDEFDPVSRQELLDRLRCRSAAVLDVRPEDEFNMGHLPSALNIPLAQLERRLAELPSNREIVAYCRGPWCVLSFEAVALLRNKGYRVRRLEDGFPEWKIAGLPVS